MFSFGNSCAYDTCLTLEFVRENYIFDYAREFVLCFKCRPRAKWYFKNSNENV